MQTPLADRAVSMDDPEPPSRDQGVETDRERRIANLVMLAFFLVLVGVGVWLANAMIDYRKVDDCLARGGRNCGPAIKVPAR